MNGNFYLSWKAITLFFTFYTALIQRQESALFLIWKCCHPLLCNPQRNQWKANLLTLHNELDQGFSWLHIKSIVLAGLTPVHPWHFSWHIHNPQCSIVTFHLHCPIRHCNFFIRSRPKDDGFRFPSYLTLKFYCVSFSGDQRWFFLWNSQIGWNLKWEKENFSRLV